jgi:hypothetical protein
MQKFGFATGATTATVCAAIVSGLAAAIIGLAAPAHGAPTGPDNAQETISALQAQGFVVIVNRISDVPLDQATVVAIRPGQNYYGTDSRVAAAGNDIHTTVTTKTVYVDVK